MHGPATRPPRLPGHMTESLARPFPIPRPEGTRPEPKLAPGTFFHPNHHGVPADTIFSPVSLLPSPLYQHSHPPFPRPISPGPAGRVVALPSPPPKPPRHARENAPPTIPLGPRLPRPHRDSHSSRHHHPVSPPLRQTPRQRPRLRPLPARGAAHPRDDRVCAAEPLQYHVGAGFVRAVGEEGCGRGGG